MSAFYAIIVMAFINGNVVDDPVILISNETHQITEQNCPDYARQALERARRSATPDVQFVVKCVDFLQLPLTVSAFGSQVKVK